VQDYLDALGDEKRRLSIQKPDPHAVELAVREPGGFRIVIGNVIEIHAHPSVSRPSSLLEIGWDPDKVRITDLHERFEADEFLRFAAPPHISSGTNGLKFALVEKSPDVSDNEELHLKVRRTDFYTVNDSVPVLEANPALREKFARLDPSQSQIPHSINLEYTVRFNDGHILGWFRENLGAVQK
jgi:hypothetical protein